ncbi:MAG: hypothetical protein M0Z48_05030 [Nitrospiraceae bacterium]|nr:hypothetical protein [Nitrospiraceae bacterium]
MKNFLGNINVLNLLLAAALVFSLTYNPGPGAQFHAGRPHGGSQPGPVKLAGFVKNGQGDVKNEAEDSLDSYAIIGRQNLFNPARTIPVERPDAAAAQPPPKPVLILRGTLITGDLSLAYIEVQQPKFGGGGPGQWRPAGFSGPAGLSEPGGPAGHGAMFPSGRYGQPRPPFYGTPMYGPGGQPMLHSAAGGKIKVYKRGDSIDGFVLTSIKPDEVTLVRDKDAMTVFLYNPVVEKTPTPNPLP